MRDNEIPLLHHLGLRLHLLTLQDLTHLTSSAIDRDTQIVLANHNLHSAFLFRRDPKMREFYDRASYIHIDGMGLVISARLAGLPARREHRVTYVDWIWPLMRAAKDHGWRVFHIGGKPGIAERAFRLLVERLPGLQIDGCHGYFDSAPESQENASILRRIAESHADILMVGMGMPRQEHWILDNLGSIDALVILPSGGCMDYVTGAVPTPPRWTGRLGLEWLFRLAAEPRRLSKRYLIEPLFLVGPLFREVVARRILRREPLQR